MLKEICLDKYESDLKHIKETKCFASKNFAIVKLSGFVDGLFWSNVIDSDEYMRLNKEVNACYLD